MEKINQKILANKEKLKKYQDGSKQCKQNKTFKKKFCQQVSRECTSTNLQSNAKKTKQKQKKNTFGVKYEKERT